jgi:acyl-CoA reductase-like NAD-dependent aldehyde dehydrogenase
MTSSKTMAYDMACELARGFAEAHVPADPRDPQTRLGSMASAGQRATVRDFIRRMRTGTVDINGAAYNPLAPFGGYKPSGVGRAMGPYGLADYVELEAVQV